MQIRRANLTDLTTTNADLVKLFDAYRVFYQKESDLKAALDFLRARVANGESVIFIAEDEASNNIVGFTQLYPLFSSTRMKRLWLLNDLYIDEMQRGKGLSKLLIKAAKELSIESGACGLILETAKSNDIGNNLYPATGFELDEDHNYYSWG